MDKHQNIFLAWAFRSLDLYFESISEYKIICSLWLELYNKQWICHLAIMVVEQYLVSPSFNL